MTNWPDYDWGLVERGDIRLWIYEDALIGWPAPRRRTRGGQARYSDLAIETVLVLATVFRLPLRQAEGFVRSVMAMMKLELTVPDHSTLSRRRRTVPIDMNAPGRKLHIVVDAATGEILAHLLTNCDTSDAAMAGPLMEDAGGRIRSVFADGAYVGAPVYDAIRAARPPRSPPKIVIPPSAPSIPTSGASNGGTERERHAAGIAARGRMAWQKEQGYSRRALVETAVFRLKRRGHQRLTARSFGAQQKEIAPRISMANKVIRDAKPVAVRLA